MDRQVEYLLGAEWSRIGLLLAGLDAKEWDLPTECPGWTVRDQVSHIIGTESMLLRRPAPPPVDPAVAPHAKNPMGLTNEAWVAARRGNTPAQMMTEFDEVILARLKALRNMTDEELAKPTTSPIGEVPYAEFMRVRLMDCWVHEQDIRRAVGRPGGFDCLEAEASLGRLTGALGFMIGKKAGAPEGASVVVELEGPLAQTLAVTVKDGRARPTPIPAHPKVRLTMNTETFVRLANGRLSGDDALLSDQVNVTGDENLGRRIVREMAIIT